MQHTVRHKCNSAPCLPLLSLSVCHTHSLSSSLLPQLVELFAAEDFVEAVEGPLVPQAPQKNRTDVTPQDQNDEDARKTVLTQRHTPTMNTHWDQASLLRQSVPRYLKRESPGPIKVRPARSRTPLRGPIDEPRTPLGPEISQKRTTPLSRTPDLHRTDTARPPRGRRALQRFNTWHLASLGFRQDSRLEPKWLPPDPAALITSVSGWTYWDRETLLA